MSHGEELPVSAVQGHSHAQGAEVRHSVRANLHHYASVASRCRGVRRRPALACLSCPVRRWASRLVTRLGGGGGMQRGRTTHLLQIHRNLPPSLLLLLLPVRVLTVSRRWWWWWCLVVVVGWSRRRRRRVGGGSKRSEAATRAADATGLGPAAAVDALATATHTHTCTKKGRNLRVNEKNK